MPRTILFCLIFCITTFNLAWATAPESAVILQYHHISDQTPPSTSTTPDMFAVHLELIEREGFEVKSLPWILDQLKNGKPLPDKTLAITFDDGYRSIYEHGFPKLKARNWPFTIFVSPEAIDNGWGEALNWDHLKEMQAAGATIANHSYYHHHLLNRLNNETSSQWQKRIKQDLLKTEKQLRDHLNIKNKLFAYPYGEFNTDLQNIIKELGYTAFGQQSGPIGAYSDMTALPRFPAAGVYANPKTLMTKLYTLPFQIVKQTRQTLIEEVDGAPVKTLKSASESTSENPENKEQKLTPVTPTLSFTLAKNGFRPNQVQCFYRGHPIETKISFTEDDLVEVVAKAHQPIHSRRARYNCTAPSNNGKRYYWFSHPWLRSSVQEG